MVDICSTCELLSFCLGLATLLTLGHLLTERLQVERLAESALQDVRVLADALMALSWGSLNPDEQTHIEIYCQAEQRFNSLAVLVRHRVNRVEHHSESLLVAVRLAQRGRSILVVAYVGLASAKYCHIRESHAEKSIICQAHDSAL